MAFGPVNTPGILEATTTSPGLMSAADKTKLDNIPDNIPVATRSVKGLMSATDKANHDKAIHDIGTLTNLMTSNKSNLVNALNELYKTGRHTGMYGYRIKKNEADPFARVEYLYDAVGMTPAHMNYSAGVFDYGSWKNLWFVRDNKPLMLKSDGTVDYYLNPDDYTKKANGAASDVADVNYDGNAMAQFPLVYVWRYEDDDYLYEVISQTKLNDNFKAYAHTRADGTIAPYFYSSLFGGSGNATKIRSLSGQSLARSLTAEQEIDGAKANGTKWYTHSWSQRALIQTLLVLMSKSTDLQSAFGIGNIQSGSESTMLTTGTLKDKGQFFGYNDIAHQVKVFHIEKPWGDQWDRPAGVIKNTNNRIYVKMTPEGDGYRITDVTGYVDTGVTIPGSGGYIKGMKCGDFGLIPNAVGGSGETYFCGYCWTQSGALCYLIVGGGAAHSAARGGAFTFYVDIAPSSAPWNVGCGLSCEMPAA